MTVSIFCEVVWNRGFVGISSRGIPYLHLRQTESHPQSETSSREAPHPPLHSHLTNHLCIRTTTFLWTVGTLVTPHQPETFTNHNPLHGSNVQTGKQNKHVQRCIISFIICIVWNQSNRSSFIFPFPRTLPFQLRLWLLQTSGLLLLGIFFWEVYNYKLLVSSWYGCHGINFFNSRYRFLLFLSTLVFFAIFYYLTTLCFICNYFFYIQFLLL